MQLQQHHRSRGRQEAARIRYACSPHLPLLNKPCPLHVPSPKSDRLCCLCVTSSSSYTPHLYSFSSPKSGVFPLPKFPYSRTVVWKTMKIPICCYFPAPNIKDTSFTSSPNPMIHTNPMSHTNPMIHSSPRSVLAKTTRSFGIEKHPADSTLCYLHLVLFTLPLPIYSLSLF